MRIDMKGNKELLQVKTVLSKVLGYKPKEAPKKPHRQPSKAELESVYIFKNNQLNEVYFT